MISALPIAGGSVACSVGAMVWAVRGRSSAVFGPSVWRGPRDRRAVALTFDDGPSEGTSRILEMLATHGALATFFPCGLHVARLPPWYAQWWRPATRSATTDTTTRCAASARPNSSKPTWSARNRLSWSTPGRGPLVSRALWRPLVRHRARAAAAWPEGRHVDCNGL